MNDSGCIMIVGKSDEWMNPGCNLLTAEGYRCHYAQDLSAAKEEIRINEFDLVLLVLEEHDDLPGDFIEEIYHEKSAIPIMILAGSASPQNMLKAFCLPIVAYLVQPIDEVQLKKNVADAIRMSHVFKTTHLVRRQLREWDLQLELLEKARRHNPRYATFFPVNDFMDLSFHHILAVIQDVRFLAKSLVNPNVDPEACHMMACPRLDILNNALHETVDVLELTKNAFKSRELGIIRKKLEQIVNGDGNLEKINKVPPENDDTQSRDRLK